MAQYLLFRLYGPLASWGEIAVGEARYSGYHPSRSMLLGLLGAALGIDRQDEPGQQALSEAFQFGVRQEARGMPLRDFHTIQVGVPGRKEVFRSRRQELSGRTETMLSSRTYLCDALHVVAVQPASDQESISLDDLKAALEKPHYPLCLGRRSCPVALPLMPRVVEADSMFAAFERAPFPSLMILMDRDLPELDKQESRDKRFFRLQDVHYFWEEGMAAGLPPSFKQWRTDQPLSRARWQFGRRREMVALTARGEV